MTTNPSPPDWRGLCEELTEFVARLTNHYYQPAELLVRARALLAQPEPERVGLSDEELLELYRGPGTFSPVEFARAAIAADRARCGRPAPAPAEGEVAELVAWLRDAAFDLNGSDPAKSMLTRAADLLEQRQAAPVPLLPEDAQPIEPTERTIMVPLQTPVPISERLPGPEDCDAEGKCWMGYWDSHVNGLGHSHKTWFWTLEDLSMVDEHTHWLPHHALPLPAGEVES